MTRPARSLVDQLCALKATGVPWDIAWAFATGGNRRDYFHPTERDDGTQKPSDTESRRLTAKGEVGEPYKRFIYRVYRAAGSLSTVRDLSDREDHQRVRRGKGAKAA